MTSTLTDHKSTDTVKVDWITIQQSKFLNWSLNCTLNPLIYERSIGYSYWDSMFQSIHVIERNGNSLKIYFLLEQSLRKPFCLSLFFFKLQYDFILFKTDRMADKVMTRKMMLPTFSSISSLPSCWTHTMLKTKLSGSEFVSWSTSSWTTWMMMLPSMTILPIEYSKLCWYVFMTNSLQWGCRQWLQYLDSRTQLILNAL